MNMNENLRKLLNRFAFVAVAATLAACSADELAQGGDGTLPQPGGPTASSGTVNFTNNTSMTIGNGLPGGTRTAWLTRGATFDMADNGACTLTMPEQPEVGDASSIGSNFQYENIGNVIKPAVIEAGITKRIGQGGEDMRVNNLDTDLFVRGTLNVENVKSDSKQGRIIVLEGGTVNFNMEKLADVAILNYGGTVNLTKAEVTIDAGAAIMTDGGLGCGDCAINVAGKLYVGGDLTCKRVASEVGGALVHVLGNLTAVPTLTVSGQNEDGTGEVVVKGKNYLCVEGVTDVYSLTASQGACVHTDCKLVANDALNSSINITNGATLCASYVETKLLHISAGAQGALTQVLLPDQGVINVDKLSLGNSMMIGLYKQGTKALVSAKTVTVENRVKWEDIVDSALYVNYDEIWADAEPADKSMINKVTMGAGGECSPGFTENEPEDPDPGTDPDDPEPEPEPTTGGEIEIPIKIDDIINEDYILKADDFAIRVNGEYMDDIKIEGDNSAKLDGVKIVNDALTIIINGLVDNPAIIEGNDYTYECWIWVENKSLLNDGTGGYGPLFDYDMYEDWANPEGDPDAEDPYGYDMTKRISESGKVKSPAGFVVRYNVYRGLAGRMDADGHGDTPYIKVSVSVQKDPDARENTNVGIWPAAYNN